MTSVGPNPIDAPTTAHRPLFDLGTGSNVVFFGNNLTADCQRCGAYCSTSMGHKYCQHVSCPLALKEFKRRKRKRTSTLEQVYMPRMLEKTPADGAGLDDADE